MVKKIAFFLVLTVAFCLSAYQISSTSSTDDEKSKRAVTFTRDVAPILQKQCADCHRPGGMAPMSLLTYNEARPWAKSIREQVAERRMPPWHADPRYGEFANERRLSQQEIDTILAWIDGGAVKGDDKDMPPPRSFVEGWRIGKPDLVLAMPEEYTLAAEGPDEYQYFTIPTNFKEDRWIQAAEARPGNNKVVHHIIAFIQPPRKKDSSLYTEMRRGNTGREKQSIFYKRWDPDPG